MAEYLEDLKDAALDDVVRQLTKNLSPEKLIIFHKLQEAGSHIIEKLKKIDNIENYFENFELSGDQLDVNNLLFIHPNAFFQMTDQECTNLLQQSLDLKKGKIKEEEFYTKVSSICKKYHIIFKKQTIDAEIQLKKAFADNNMEVNKIPIFKDMKTQDVNRLDFLFTNICKNYEPTHIKVSRKAADLCRNVAEFTAATEYIIRQIERQASEAKKNNSNSDRPSHTKATDYFYKQKAEEFLSSPESIVNGFIKLRDECDAANKETLRFGNSSSLANHYDKHSIFPQIDGANKISLKRYLKIANEMCSRNQHEEKWTQNGESICYKFISEEYGATAIMYKNFAKGTSTIASLRPIAQKS